MGRNIKTKILASVLAVVTATTPVVSYAADFNLLSESGGGKH